MFRVIKIGDIMDGSLDEESMLVEDAFFFTISVPNYYAVYNHAGEIIGRIPLDYFMFFKIDGSPVFEDIDMENALRLHEQGDEFQIVGTKANSHKVKMISSSDILKFELVEDNPIQIPFTNSAFDSEGIVIFKNMNSLADSLDPEDYL
jgi:hypothetical protein